MSAGRWLLLSCGCQVTLHGRAPAPTWCPDCERHVTSSQTRTEETMTHEHAAWLAARLDELRAAAYQHDTHRVDAVLDELADAPGWIHRLAAALQAPV